MKKTLLFKFLAITVVTVFILTTTTTIFPVSQKYNWKLASVLPDTHPVHKALVFFANKVNEKTKGEVKITVYPAGQLGQEKDFIEGVKGGSIEITKVSSSPLGQFSPSLQALSLPFIWRDLNHQHKVLNGPIGNKLMADLEKSGFKGLAFFDAGFRSLTTRDKPIKTPADLKGMKIRVMQSKPLIDTINAFGANAVPMGQSDVYVALQQKIIDGWENNEPTVLNYNMQEVCKYFSYSRHISTPDILVMSKKIFDSVPINIQKAIMDAAKETIPYQQKIWEDDLNNTINKLKGKGMVFNEVTNIKDFQNMVKPIYQQYEKDVGADLIKSIIETK